MRRAPRVLILFLEVLVRVDGYKANANAAELTQALVALNVLVRKAQVPCKRVAAAVRTTHRKLHSRSHLIHAGHLSRMSVPGPPVIGTKLHLYHVLSCE